MTGVVGRAIDEAQPDIQRSAMLVAIEAAQTDIKAHMTTRTSFGQALLTNLIAWVLSLAAAALVLHLATKPNVDQTLAGSPMAPTGNAQ